MSHFLSVVPSLNENVFTAYDRKNLETEPSLSWCSRIAAKQYCGPITQSILDMVEKRYEYPIRRALEAGLHMVVDVRVHHLCPGHLADIPGWHSDGVPAGGYSCQPNYSLVHPLAFNVGVLLSSEVAGVSGIEFVRDVIRPRLYDTDHVFRNVHDEVMRIKPATLLATDGWAVWYSPHSILREQPAHRAGTRYHFRLRMMEKPMWLNKVSHQLQVYLIQESGW